MAPSHICPLQLQASTQPFETWEERRGKSVDNITFAFLNLLLGVVETALYWCPCGA